MLASLLACYAFLSVSPKVIDLLVFHPSSDGFASSTLFLCLISSLLWFLPKRGEG